MEIPQKQTAAKTAADVVVDAAGNGNATTIEAGLALTPDSGTCVVLDGTYTVPSGGYLVDKKRLIGVGNAVVLDLGALIQGVFGGIGFFVETYIENVKIICDSLAGQRICQLSHSGVTNGDEPRLVFKNVKIGQNNLNQCPRTLFVQQSTNNSIQPRVLLIDCNFYSQTQQIEIIDRNTSTNRHEIEFVRTFLAGPFNASGLLATITNEWRFTDSEIRIGTGGMVIKGSVIAAKTRFLTQTSVVGSMIEMDAVSQFIGCRFSGVSTRNLELLSGANDSIIAACRFAGGSSEALKTSALNGRFGSSSRGLKILEAGSADKNYFTDIETGSVIIGTHSKINGALRAVVAPAVGDDINDGVLIGNHWIDTVADKEYVCVDNAVGAAVWIETTMTAAAGAQIKTGSYTGDGTTSQGITGVGFSPKYAKIWQRETVDDAIDDLWETTPDIMDDNAAGGSWEHSGAGDKHAFRTNRIISLDVDGFTVDDNGANSDPNSSGVVYNYMAIG